VLEEGVYFTSAQMKCGCKPDEVTAEENPDGSDLTYEGDQVLDSEDRAKKDGHTGKFRANINDTKRLWPGGKVPFMFEDEVDEKLRDFIRKSLKELQTETNQCIRFEEGTRFNEPHIRVNKKNFCRSRIGRINDSKGQPLAMGAKNCLFIGVVKHEFMHALGFLHEQVRPDRDAYVKINWNNIDSRECANFKKCRGCAYDAAPYQVDSIMHYHSKLFMCNGNFSIVRLDGSRIKFQNNLSDGDIMKIKILYKCPPFN